MRDFLHTAPLVHEPGAVMTDEEAEATFAATSLLAAHAATEVGASPMPRIPRGQQIPGAGALVVPVVFFLVIAAVAIGWHVLSRVMA